MTGSDTRSFARFLVEECYRTSRDWDRRFNDLARDHDAHLARIHERELAIRAQFEAECG